MRCSRTHGCAGRASRTDYRPDGGARFRTWLFTLAPHRAIDCLRGSGREMSVDFDGDEPFAPDGTPWLGWPAERASGHDERLFWRRAGARLLDCLEQLPAAQKAVFLMHHDDGVPVEELARAARARRRDREERACATRCAKLRTCMGGPAGARGMSAPYGRSEAAFAPSRREARSARVHR